MMTIPSLVAGVAGAGALNLIHESARKTIPNAPHVDLLAMRGVGLFFLRPLGAQVPLGKLRRWVLAGDLISNSLYYAAVVGASRNQNPASVWKRSLAWGLFAGGTVVALPSLLRMQQQESRNFPVTAALTVAWYTIGSLTAAAVFNFQSKARE